MGFVWAGAEKTEASAGFGVWNGQVPGTGIVQMGSTEQVLLKVSRIREEEILAQRVEKARGEKEEAEKREKAVLSANQKKQDALMSAVADSFIRSAEHYLKIGRKDIQKFSVEELLDLAYLVCEKDKHDSLFNKMGNESLIVSLLSGVTCALCIWWTVNWYGSVAVVFPGVASIVSGLFSLVSFAVFICKERFSDLCARIGFDTSMGIDALRASEAAIQMKAIFPEVCVKSQRDPNQSGSTGEIYYNYEQQ